MKPSDDMSEMLRELSTEDEGWALTPPEDHLERGRHARRRRTSGLAIAGVVAFSLLGGGAFVLGDVFHRGGTGIIEAAGQPGATDARFFRQDVVSDSMEPSIIVGESIVYDRTLQPALGDVVLVSGDPDANDPDFGPPHAYRIVALAGDTVGCFIAPADGCAAIAVNGTIVQQAYEPAAPMPLPTVAGGEGYLLGDGWSKSQDSLHEGMAPLSLVTGVAVQVIGADGQARPVPDAPAHDVPGPDDTVDLVTPPPASTFPPAADPTAGSPSPTPR